MKILVITPYISPVYGGITKVVSETLKEISSPNISIDLITTHASSSDILPVPLNTWINHENYRVQYFSSWHRNDFIMSLSLIFWIFNHVSDYDLVHTHTIFSPLISIAQRICQFRGIPYIATPHGMLEPWALGHKALKKKIYYHLLEKFSLDKAATVQVLTTAEFVQLKVLGFRNIAVVPNGICRQDFNHPSDPEIFYRSFPTTRNKKLIIFLGRLDPKKGLDLLAPAFAQVHAVFPNAHLVIAGPDNIGFTSTVQRYFSNANCLHAITFTGMLTGALKYSALNASDIYICPSYSEGFSISVLEGMATGLPCIITENCNFPEAQAAQAAYVVKANIQDISEALMVCFSSPHEADRIAKKARQFIFQNYTWEQSAQKLLVAYYAIIKKKRNLPTSSAVKDMT